MSVVAIASYWQRRLTAKRRSSLFGFFFCSVPAEADAELRDILARHDAERRALARRHQEELASFYGRVRRALAGTSAAAPTSTSAATPTASTTALAPPR